MLRTVRAAARLKVAGGGTEGEDSAASSSSANSTRRNIDSIHGLNEKAPFPS
jgi:hypothetical protein